MSSSSIDPDIQAAFSSTAPTASSHANVDDDIAAAFKDSNRPAIGDSIGHGIQDMVGGIARGVGTLVDVGRNDARVFQGKPTFEYGSPESTAYKFSQPFQHAPDDESTTDPKEQIRRALPKLTDQPLVKRALDTPAGQTLTSDVLAPAASIGQAALTVAPILGGAGKLLSKDVTPQMRVEPTISGPPGTGETPSEVLQRSAAGQSMGAAADGGRSTVSLLSPETQAEIQAAGKRGETINQDAYQRHLDAETLPQPEGTSPLRLRKGNAAQDSQQISDEKNLRADPDTQGILSSSIEDQDKKLVSSMGEIRRRATPDIVQRNNLEHAQSSIDSIKTADNQAVLDIRAKYKTLADANGGAMPIDTGQVGASVESKLAKQYLTKTAAETPQISEVLDSLKSGKPLDFEGFEAARSRLAEVQRAGGSAGTAAGIVRGELENMPLLPEAKHLKGLADDARAAAKARFDTTESNPAYEAAINDNVPKDKRALHVIGAPSPLADSFMDRYFLGNGTNASKAYIQRIKDVMKGDPTFGQSIEASTLNRLRDAAGIDPYGNGTFKNASYRNARAALDPKAEALLGPESIEHTEQLKRVSGYVNDEGKASSTNRSNTALTLQRFGAQYPSNHTLTSTLIDHGADVAASHLGAVGVIGKRVGQTFFKNAQDAKSLQALKDAKLQFAIDATKPGAGISH